MRPPWATGANARLGLLLVVVALVVGRGVAAGAGTLILVAVAVMGFTAIGVRSWRVSVLGLLVFLPYSGLLIIAAYPDTGPTALAKDFLFVIPAYLGFAGYYLLGRRPVQVLGFPLGIAVVFATIVLLQLLNPSLPNIVVGLIGAKVWLLYIPMAFLGYHLIRTKGDLRQVLFLLSVAAVIPLIVGIVEGVLVSTGHENFVYGFYGDAAGAVTQQFGAFGVGDTTVKRVPSTFSFVAQYFLFTISMVSVSYAYWRGFLNTSHTTSWLGAALFVLVVCASLLSGARGALVAVPAMVAVMLLLDGVSLRIWLWLPAVALAALVGVAAVFGTSFTGLVGGVLSHGVDELILNTVDGFGYALGRTTTGLGSGVDTVSARYSLPAADPYALVGGLLRESWWVKALLELGIAGLLVVLALLGTIIARVSAAHRRLVDPQLRSVSAGLVTLLAFVLFYNFKGSYLDFDPTNVFFWLFVGIVLKLPQLDEAATDPTPASSTAPTDGSERAPRGHAARARAAEATGARARPRRADSSA